MDLTNFQKVDKTIKATTFLSLTICIITAVAFCTAFFYLSSKIEKAYREVLVIDTNGNVYNPTTVKESSMRVYEYENHIKAFINNWYAFDETNYEKRINAALNLIGNRGKELLSEYRDIEMYNSLITKNIRYDVVIKDVVINMNTVPVSGEADFVQMGFRAKGNSARDVYVQFSLYDVDRSRENPHGVKIEDWKVRFSEPRELTHEESKSNKAHVDEL